MHTPKLLTLALTTVALTITGCATQHIELATPAAPTTALPLPPGARLDPIGETPIGENFSPMGSFRPERGVKPEMALPDITRRGFVIAGVDQSQNLLSFRNATTGEVQGFEVDIAREIARDIFGDPTKVDFRFVDGSDQEKALSSGKVDFVIRALPIGENTSDNHSTQLQFSAPYLATRTRLLTLGDKSADDVTKSSRLCASAHFGVNTLSDTFSPDTELLKTRTWADCLVALQQHQTDAIVADDAILAGIAAQDPYTRIIGPVLGQQRYGIAFAHDAPISRIRFINGTLERIKRDGTWWRLYNTWLSAVPTDGPPPAHYRED